MENLEKSLIEKAMEASKLAYAPYSRYHVGAALLATDGQIFTGCNIENISYAATNCAERTAFFKAVSEGVRSFQMIAIVGGPASEEAADTFSDYAFPCGICRPAMKEFCQKDFIVLVAKSPRDYKKFTLEELLPYAF